MPFLLQYIIKLSISLSLVYLFYQLFLRKLTFYNWNRWYLLGYTLLSFYLSFVDISPALQKNELTDFSVINLLPGFEQVSLTAVQNKGLDMDKWDLLILLIAAGGLILLARLLIQVISFRKMKSTARLLSDDGLKVYQMDRDIAPFSFGNAIFINRHQHNQAELESIIRHELVHVKQKHTIDIIWAEIFCMLNWFNPFAWLLRKAIRQNLEFIADKQVLSNGADRKQYQYLLLKVLGNNSYSIASNFNFSSLKKRIAMMNKMQSAKVHLVKFLFILPLIAVMLLAFRNRGKQDHSSGALQPVYFKAVIDTTPKPPSPPPPPPVPLKPNKKGYYLSVADDNGECVVVIRDKNRKIIEAMAFTEWTANEEANRSKYGTIPPPPPPAGKSITVTEKPLGNPDLEPIVVTGYSTVNDKPLPVQVRGMTLEKSSTGDEQGTPLYIIDGKERSIDKAQQLDDYVKPTDIESINILKGETAVKKYGSRAENGVVEIKTKPKTGFSDFGSFRGLVIIDGVEIPENKRVEDMISLDDIKSVSVLKGESAEKKYGIKGRNGVLEITTKKEIKQDNREPVVYRTTGALQKGEVEEGRILCKITRKTTKEDLKQMKEDLEKKGFVLKVENLNFNDGELTGIRGEVRSREDNSYAHFQGEDFTMIVVLFKKDNNGDNHIHVKVTGSAKVKTRNS